MAPNNIACLNWKLSCLMLEVDCFRLPLNRSDKVQSRCKIMLKILTRRSAVAVTAYCVRRTVYWQTIKPVSVTSLRTGGTHDPIQRVELPKLYLHKRECATIERARAKFNSSRS